MGSSGGGGGGTNINYVRYAPYIEDKHSHFLSAVERYAEKARENNPFKNYDDVDVEDAFFGVGFTISSFPSLYDMYGKFMAGLDIDALYSQIFTTVTNSPEVNALIAAESVSMDDDIETTSLPRLELGARDLNSVMSSSFIVGKSIVEDAKVKALSKFSAQLKFNLIPLAESIWKTHLEWNKGVVGVYSEIMKFYFSAKTDTDEINYAMAAKSALWHFTVFDFQRACLGALQGATVQKSDVAGASTASKVLSGALSGASMGAMIGGQISPAVAANATTGAAASAGGAPWGAGIGAILGIGAALTY